MGLGRSPCALAAVAALVILAGCGSSGTHQAAPAGRADGSGTTGASAPIPATTVGDITYAKGPIALADAHGPRPRIEVQVQDPLGRVVASTTTQRGRGLRFAVTPGSYVLTAASGSLLCRRPVTTRPRITTRADIPCR